MNTLATTKTIDREYDDKQIYRRRVVQLAYWLRHKNRDAANAYLDEFKGSYAVKLFLDAALRNIKLEKTT